MCPFIMENTNRWGKKSFLTSKSIVAQLELPNPPLLIITLSGKKSFTER